MAQDNTEAERKVSVSVSIRAGSLTKAQAQELEDKIRDLCDDFEGVDVMVTRGAERPQGR